MKRIMTVTVLAFSLMFAAVSCSFFDEDQPSVKDSAKQTEREETQENGRETDPTFSETNEDISGETSPVAHETNPANPDYPNETELIPAETNPSTPDDPKETDAEPMETEGNSPIGSTVEEKLIEMGFEKVEKTESEERTIEELLQALHDGEPMRDTSGADYGTLPPIYTDDEEEPVEIVGTTVQFSEEPWEAEKTVEYAELEELTAEMSPEEKAEFDEMMSMTEEEWEEMIRELEAEMEEMVKEFNEDSGEDTPDYPDYPDYPDTPEIDWEEYQKQLEEALEQLPDEYKDMLGEDFDFSDLFS